MAYEKELDERLARRAEEAARRAEARARIARWDMNIVIFMFAILAMVVILLFEGVGVEIVAPIALAGFAMCWLAAWRRGRELSRHYYREEWKREKEAYELERGGVLQRGEERLR